MKYPILIAARNEAELLPNTLRSIPRDAAPTVIANGCTDDTVQVAQRFGVEVIELEKPSKMAALKAGMRQHASSILEVGFSVLDADTELVSKRYVSAVQQKFGEVACGVLVSPMLFKQETGRINMSTTIWQGVSRYRHRKKFGQSFVHGANLILRPTADTLEQMLEIPDDLWPREDTRMVDIHRESGVEIDTYDLRLAAVTSLRAHSTIWERFMRGTDACDQERAAWQASRAPDRSTE